MTNDPVLIAYALKDKRTARKAAWTRIGVAFPNDTGAGLTVILDALPRDGRIVLVEPRIQPEAVAPPPAPDLHEAIPLADLAPGSNARSLSAPMRAALSRLERLYSADALPLPRTLAGASFSPAEAALIGDDYAAYATGQILAALEASHGVKPSAKTAELIHREVLHVLDVLLATLLEHQC